MFDPVINFLIAWLLMALIGQVPLAPEVSRIAKILIIVIALVVIVLGAHGRGLG